MLDLFEDLSAELESLGDAKPRGVAAWWAVVVSVEPLRVRREGEADALPVTPESLVSDLMPGDKVKVLNLFGRLTVLGRHRGGMRRVALKSHLDAWPAPEGTIAYVTADNRHYVRSSGVWLALLPERTDWQELTYSAPFAEYSASAGLRIRKTSDVVFLEGTSTCSVAEHFSGSNRYQARKIATIPEGYRPERTHAFVCHGSSLDKWLLRVNPNGDLMAERYDGTQNVGVWLPVAVSWSII